MKTLRHTPLHIFLKKYFHRHGPSIRKKKNAQENGAQGSFSTGNKKPAAYMATGMITGRRGKAGKDSPLAGELWGLWGYWG